MSYGPTSYGFIRPKFKFYPGEGRDIGIAVLILTLAFFVLISPLPYRIPGAFETFYFLLISFVAVLTAFFSHEMSHKYVAIRFGYPAAFRRWDLGLILALFLSFLGFIFAAPGAVYIYGMPSRRENGLISSAGPVSNLAIGFALLGLSFIIRPSLLFFSLRYIAQLNFFLSFFNLLPIPPMDGTKVLSWRIDAYLMLMALSIIGLVALYL